MPLPSPPLMGQTSVLKPSIPRSKMVHGNLAPKVSIGLPVFNGARFLPAAIESALSQTFQDLELIIADNASTDETEDICNRYAKLDRRVKVVRHPRNIGAAKNYNYVFHAASGEFFNWLASDDLLRPGFLRACLDGFASHKRSPILVYPNFEFIDERDETVEPPDFPSPSSISSSPFERFKEALECRGPMIALFGVFRRDVLRTTRLIGSFASSDLVLLSECALLGPIVRLDGPPMFCRRFHPERSRVANATAEALAHWFDPDSSPERNEENRLQREYFVSVRDLDGLSRHTRLAAFALLARRRASWMTSLELRRLRRRTARLLPMGRSAH